MFVFSFLSLSVSHRTTPTEYGAGDIRETDGRIWSFSGCQRNPIPRSARASRNEAALEFECPEEFGYYPHPRDCTQYYVCVFGGALLESCTGGLMYRWVLFSRINSNRCEMAFREDEFADGKKEGRDEYGRKHFHTNLKSFSCA